MYDEKRRIGELAAAKEADITEVAMNMLKARLPYDQIVQLTGLDYIINIIRSSALTNISGYLQITAYT